jgi:hypothetical protein
VRINSQMREEARASAGGARRLDEPACVCVKLVKARLPLWGRFLLLYVVLVAPPLPPRGPRGLCMAARAPVNVGSQVKSRGDLRGNTRAARTSEKPARKLQGQGLPA